MLGRMSAQRCLGVCFACGVIAATTTITSCGEPTPEKPVCVDYVVPAGLDLQKSEVRFRAEIVPIFVQSCAFTSCHGRETGGSAGLFLGLKDSTFDAARVRQSLVAVAATELRAMSLVSAGDPEASYLMRKLDGDHCLLDAQCEKGDCGAGMPRTGELLPVADRDRVRRWIAQGAKDD